MQCSFPNMTCDISSLGSKISLTPQLFIEVHAPIQEREQSFICVRDIGFVSKGAIIYLCVRDIGFISKGAIIYLCVRDIAFVSKGAIIYLCVRDIVFFSF